MLTNYQKQLVGDLSGPGRYGAPLVGWKGQIEFFRNAGAPGQPGPLTADLASTFVEEVYLLVRLERMVTVYRGFETAALQAPFGKDHPTLIQGLVSTRRPGKPDGLWWTPSRPSMAIDNLGLSDMHRSEHRSSSAVLLEWNRLDYYLEADLPTGALVFVGRAAPQQDKALYGGNTYSGGAIQFRLTQPPNVKKTYSAS